MPTEPSGLDVDAETDRLYQVSLDAFVEARNALAARLRSRGDKEGAARVKALVRPNLPAWAANQVYWTARPDFDGLLASVERMRTAQLPGAMGGAALRDAMKARREAQDLVLRRAAAVLRSAGHGTNAGTLLRVSNTLEALAAQGADAALGRPGRLAHDLEPPGFEVLSALAEAPPTAHSRAGGAPWPPKPVVPEWSGVPVEAKGADPADERRARGTESLRAALTESEKRLDRARREAREASGALSVAEKRAEAARAELEEATRRLARAHERGAVTAADADEARRKADQLAESRDAAEAERDAALRSLRAFEES